MPQFFIPNPSLKPLGLGAAMRLARTSGFDGMEMFLTLGTNHSRIRRTAELEHMGLHWHEIWSLEEGSNHGLNHLLAAAGMIPYRRRPLADWMPDDDIPVVCYPDRHGEISRNRGDRLWLQACRTMIQKTTYDDFVRIVRDEGFCVVFDTQHVLELRTNRESVGALRDISSSTLQELLLETWGDLGTHTREIHFNNFDPRGGATGGRNLLPDKGVLDLNAFAKKVLVGGWDGVVTPEVAPKWLSPLPSTGFLPFFYPSQTKLEELRAIVGRMFTS